MKKQLVDEKNRQVQKKWLKKKDLPEQELKDS